MKQKRVLIVEDEFIIAFELQSMIQKLGYEVISIVDSGQKAIEMVETERPDIILMDIRIKGDLDGIDTAGIIKSKFNAPIIFSSAYLDEDKFERAKITLPYGYILKPVQERDLKITLEMALHVSDIDAKRRYAEQKLKESEERFRTVVENAQEWIWETDRQGRFSYSSSNVKDILGYTPEEIVGKKYYYDFYHPDEKERLKKKTFEAYKDQRAVRRFVNRNLHRNGNEVWLETNGTPLFDADGKVKGYRGLDVNITPYKQVERELKESKHRFLFHMENTPVGVIEFDLDYNITFWNRAAEHIFGYSKKEIIGRNAFDTIIPQDLKRDLLRHFDGIDVHSRTENINENVRKDGQRIKCKWWDTIILNLDMERVGMASLCIDVNERSDFWGVRQESFSKRPPIFD